MEFDFGGYVTKNDVLCADGRTIRKNAFKAQNGTKVPLVWMHQRNEPENVLGHAYLENREDGVYGYCKFNNSARGKQAKLLVEHGDISSMSIFANNLIQKGSNVTHGMIREVSLVIAPANPGALIDNPVVQHSDGEEYEDLTRATITCGEDIDFNVEYEIEHADEPKKKPRTKTDPDNDEYDVDPEDLDDEEDDQDSDDDPEDEEEEEDMDPKKKQSKSMQHADDEDNEETVQDVYDAMTDKQKQVVAFLIGTALEQSDEENEEAEQSDMEGDDFMPRNVFDQNNEMEMSDTYTPTLSHDQLSCIFDDAQKCGSLKKSFISHAQEYGIENIDVLFPDAKVVGDNPYMIKRPTEWVTGVLNETTHVPFNRIKTTAADITADEARAKGYVKGNLKKEEIIKLLKRITTPTTVYKKQKLDKDDIDDITDLNIVAWIKAEMRVMLDEEVARAILVSDNREIDDEDKINEDNIRPIWKDDDMYAHHIILPSDVAPEELSEYILRGHEDYKGSGNPSFYTTSSTLLDMLLAKDKIGRRLFNTDAELSASIGVSKIVKVPVMDRLTRTTTDGKTVKLLGIMVNLRDYTVGATAGGRISMFDDFDIDYNQYKYLLETRCCGALSLPKSAVVFEQEVGVAGASTRTAEIG